MRGLGRIFSLVLGPAFGRAAQPPASSPLVGGNVCRPCHPDVWAPFYKNPHHKSLASGKEPPEGAGWESFHGPGNIHVEARGGKTTILAFPELPSNAIANLTAYFDFRKRADLLADYRHSEDTGDGRATADGPGIGSALPVFQVSQTFPLMFRSPRARFSMRLTGKIRWNAGCQYYGYSERFLTGDDYRAHTGHSSVPWSF